MGSHLLDAESRNLHVLIILQCTVYQAAQSTVRINSLPLLVGNADTVLLLHKAVRQGHFRTDITLSDLTGSEYGNTQQQKDIYFIFFHNSLCLSESVFLDFMLHFCLCLINQHKEERYKHNTEYNGKYHSEENTGTDSLTAC